MHLRLVEHLLLGIYFTMLFSITVFSIELCTKVSGVWAFIVALAPVLHMFRGSRPDELLPSLVAVKKRPGRYLHYIILT